MTIVSDDPNMWPLINFHRIFSYFTVAALTVVLYDWALAIGHEVELVWRKRWSLMTVLYISVRYTGIIYCVNAVLRVFPYMRTLRPFLLTCNIMCSNTSVILGDRCKVSVIVDRLLGLI